MKTATTRAPAAHNTTPAKPSTKARMLTRAQILSELKPDMQDKMRRGDEKTRNFILDTIRLGRAGILKFK